MFICEECGIEYEDRIAFRLDLDCRKCGGRLLEAKECKVCGEYHIEDELIGGVCEDCIDEYRRDIDACAEIGSESRETVEINSFLLSFFDAKEIEAILLEHLKETQPDADCSPFIDNDISWFAEKVSA